MNKNNLRRIAVFMAMLAASPQMKAGAVSLTVAYGGPSFWEKKPVVVNNKAVDNKKFYKNPKIMAPIITGIVVFSTGVTLLSLWGAGVIGKKENEEDKNNKGSKKTKDNTKSSTGGIETTMDMCGGPGLFSKKTENNLNDKDLNSIEKNIKGENEEEEKKEEEKEEKNTSKGYWELVNILKACNSIQYAYSYNYSLTKINKRKSDDGINALRSVKLDKQKFEKLIKISKNLSKISDRYKLSYSLLKVLKKILKYVRIKK